jgi:hypothetical protein
MAAVSLITLEKRRAQLKEDREKAQRSLNLRISIFLIGVVVGTTLTLVRILNGVPLIRAGFYEAISDVATLIAIPIFAVLLVITIREKRQRISK